MTLYNQIEANKRKSILIMIVFIVVIGIIGYSFSVALDYGYSVFFGAIIISTASSVFSFYFSDSISLAISGAIAVDKQTESRLFRMVENLSIGAGIVPMPKVYIMEDNAINAFATGRDPKHSSIAVTRGALDRLEDLELEGVLAHELSHIQNYDTRTMTIVVVLVGIIAMASEWFMRISFRSGKSRNREGSGIFMIIALIGVIIGPIVAQLLKFAMSRQREFLADASGALLTRYPEGLAQALEKIGVDQTPMDHDNTAIAHLYISSPLGAKGQKISDLFSTHPPIEERIARLRLMQKV